MRAAVVERYGGPEVARVIELPRPRPAGDEVLVRVVAAAVTSGDARVRAARYPPGFGVLPRLAQGQAGQHAVRCRGGVGGRGRRVRA